MIFTPSTQNTKVVPCDECGQAIVGFDPSWFTRSRDGAPTAALCGEVCEATRRARREAMRSMLAPRMTK
jgi:hypothetical protein